jgi:hypothetical protein
MHGGPDPSFRLFKEAARGSLVAQRTLAEIACEMAIRAEDPLEPLTEGLVFARLAAAQGDQSDEARVIRMIAMAKHYCEPRVDMPALLAEAIARLERVADGRGDQASQDLAAESLNSLVDGASIETTELARWFSQQMKLADAASPPGDQ